MKLIRDGVRNFVRVLSWSCFGVNYLRLLCEMIFIEQISSEIH